MVHMGMALPFAGALLIAVSAVCGEPPAARVPVLLELFTSEGCSSCPPADRLLENLDRDQPVAGAEVVVLSEHVDYWNHLGWKDPFSSAFFSDRQRQYARSLGGEVYTPEMVVDGVKGLVGSEEREAESAIKNAARAPKRTLRVTASREGKQARVDVRCDSPIDGVLYLALAHDAIKSHVLKGENAGRGLSHVAVVYSIGKAALGESKVSLSGENEKTRIVVFAAKPGGGVTAVGQARL